MLNSAQKALDRLLKFEHDGHALRERNGSSLAQKEKAMSYETLSLILQALGLAVAVATLIAAYRG